MPQPKTPEKGQASKKPKTVMDKLRRFPKALALSGALSIGAATEACVPISSLNLTPTAEQAHKTTKELREREAACREGISQSLDLQRLGKPQAAILARLSEQKFAAALIAVEGRLWDENSFVEGQAILDAAKNANKDKK